LIVNNTKWSHIPQIRPLDTHRDLAQAADLIELCFSATMDDDGRSYLRQIRGAGEDHNQVSWVPGAGERISVPLYGYVWEENGRIVGNLSLIPFMDGLKWIYLIANVAVHPAYRGQGIGRILTERALEHIQEREAAAWLQVRDDNDIAQNLYRSLGFIEKARRTNWRYKPGNAAGTPPISPEVVIQNRSSTIWKDQKFWLNQAYPPEIGWYLSFNKKRYGPSLWQTFIRFVGGNDMRHWSGYLNNRLIGVVTWEPGRSVDVIWLGLDIKYEDVAIQALVTYLCNTLCNRPGFIINYPANRGKQALRKVSFVEQNTLIWMEKTFT
jgi:ribosomal protein S18 acetylase RimI-like enzyme